MWNRSAGTFDCYAGNIHERFAPSKAYPGPFEQIALHPGRMATAAAWPDLAGQDRPDKPWLSGLPRHVFVGDMADLFSSEVPFPYLKAELIDTALGAKGQRHVWMTLTKQPHRLVAFRHWLGAFGHDWPANVWPGTSVTSQATIRRAEVLAREFPGRHFLSVEPLRGEVDLTRAFAAGRPNLVIVGGESGPRAHACHMDWIRSVIRQCRDAGISCFVKQLGSHRVWSEADIWAGHADIRFRDSKGGDWSEWPDNNLRVREFPAIIPSEPSA